MPVQWQAQSESLKLWEKMPPVSTNHDSDVVLLAGAYQNLGETIQVTAQQEMYYTMKAQCFLTSVKA